MAAEWVKAPPQQLLNSWRGGAAVTSEAKMNQDVISGKMCSWQFQGAKRQEGNKAGIELAADFGCIQFVCRSSDRPFSIIQMWNYYAINREHRFMHVYDILLWIALWDHGKSEIHWKKMLSSSFWSYAQLHMHPLLTWRCFSWKWCVFLMNESWS